MGNVEETLNQNAHKNKKVLKTKITSMIKYWNF